MKRNTISILAVSLAIMPFANAQTPSGSDGTLRTRATETVEVVKQPTTYVEASAIEESRAERMRKARQDIEVQTEQRIVEKLEASRLEDEQKRVDRIFGDKAGAVAAPAPAVQIQAPVQQVVVPVEAPKAVTQEDLANTKKEILSAIQGDTKPVAPVAPVAPAQPIAEQPAVDAKTIAEIAVVKEFRKRYYLGTIVGLQDYMDAQNIESRGSAGVLLGTEIDRNFLIEGGFLYSNYYIEDVYWGSGVPVFREMNQWNLTFAAKYSFTVSDTFRPYIGGMTSYTYRKYYDRYVPGPMGPQQAPPNEQEATSWAFDLAPVAGVNLVFGDNFGVGAEFRYYWNLFYRSDSQMFDVYKPNGVNMVEETSYTAFLINGYYRF